MPSIVPLDREPDKGKTPAGQHRGLDRRSLNCMDRVAQFQTRTFRVVVLCSCLPVLRGALQKVGMAFCWLEISTLTHLQRI